MLPSRSEGMGRVLIEAFCRARPAVASRVGGIPDLVEDGVNGLLVEPGDISALAEALVAVLADRELAVRLGAGPRRAPGCGRVTPEEFAARLRAFVEQTAGLS